MNNHGYNYFYNRIKEITNKLIFRECRGRNIFLTDFSNEGRNNSCYGMGLFVSEMKKKQTASLTPLKVKSGYYIKINVEGDWDHCFNISRSVSVSFLFLYQKTIEPGVSFLKIKKIDNKNIRMTMYIKNNSAVLPDFFKSRGVTRSV